jgi:hypothetical protein
VAVVLAFAVLALGAASALRWRRTGGPRGVEAVVLVGALVLAAVGIAATVLAVLGMLSSATLAGALGAAAALVWPWRGRTTPMPVSARAGGWIQPLLLVGIALALRLPFMDYALAGRDQGTYTLRAEHTARTSAIAFVDPVLERAGAEREQRSGPDDLLGLYPRRGESWRTDVYEGSYRPGFYLADRESGVVVPQFLHLHPMLLTAAIWIVGREPMGLVVVLEGVLAVLAVFAVGRRLWGSGPWPGVAAVLVALSPLAVWVHRNALTEALTGLLTWAAVLACLRARGGERSGLELAAALLGATAWVRGNAWITAPVVLAVLWLVPVDTPRRWRARAIYLAVLAGSVLVHASSSFPYLVDELRRQLASWSQPAPIGIVGAFALGAVAWASVDVLVFGLRGPRALAPWIDRVRTALPRVLVAAFAAAIAIWIARRLGADGAPYARLDLVPAGLGLPLAVGGAIGLGLAVPRLRVRTAADVWLAAIAALVVATAWLYAGRNLPKTGLYYYGRYLVPELLPLAAITAAHGLAVVHERSLVRLGRWASVVTAGVAAALVGSVAAVHVLQPQTRLQEFEGAHRIVDAIASHVPADAVVVAGGEGWHHGHTFNQVGGALALRHGRVVLPYVTREAAYATLVELLVEGPRARGTAPPAVFLLVNEATHAYRPTPGDPRAAIDDLLPPPFSATQVHGLELVVHRLTPDEHAPPMRATRDELRMALVRVEVDPTREREVVSLGFDPPAIAIAGGRPEPGVGHCLAPDGDVIVELPPALARDTRSIAIVAVPGTAATNHSWSVVLDHEVRSLDPPGVSGRARDTIGPLPVAELPQVLRVGGSRTAVAGAACPHGGIEAVRLLGLDGSALARLDVHGEVFVPSSDLGHPHPPARWVAGRGLSRYRSGFAVAPEIGALSLAVRPGADVRFGPEPIPGHGRAPLDVVVTLTGAQTSPDARVRVLADGRVVAELDPPDARDRSWQSPPARVELGSDVVRFSLEMVDGAPDDVAWVRDIALFAVPR